MDPKAVREMVGMEEDPDGTTHQVAVIMTGEIYRTAGLKNSKHPEVEGKLYDKLCTIGKHKLRDEVRLMAKNIAKEVSDKKFEASVSWLDEFSRRFCLSRKKMGFHSANMLKTKGAASKSPLKVKFNTEVDTGETKNNKTTTENGHSNDGSESSKNSKTVNGKTTSEEESEVPEDPEEDPLKINSDEAMEADTVSDNASKTETPKKSDDAKSIPDTPKSKEKPAFQFRLKKMSDLMPSPKKTKAKESSDEDVKSDDKDEDQEAIEDTPDTDSSNDSKEEKGGETSNEGESDAGSEKESEKESDKESEKEVIEVSDNDNKEEKTDKNTHLEDLIEYSKEETKYWKKNLEALEKKVNEEVFRCTSCNEQVNHQIRALVKGHPHLGVFLCKRCRKFYGKGRFCKDEEGYDEYCRWCAEGGDLLCCEQEGCFNGFCKRCIKRNLGRSEASKAENAENWACYVCDKTPLMETRAILRTILYCIQKEERKADKMSRSDHKKKDMKSKFDLLKRNRLKKAQQKTPEKSSEKNKDSKDKVKKEVKSEEDNKADLLLELCKSENRGEPWLQDSIDSMADMIQICQFNLKKIDQRWKKDNCSIEATAKAVGRILKQMKAMSTNFSVIEEHLTKPERTASTNEDGTSASNSNDNKENEDQQVNVENESEKDSDSQSRKVTKKQQEKKTNDDEDISAKSPRKGKKNIIESDDEDENKEVENEDEGENTTETKSKAELEPNKKVTTKKAEEVKGDRRNRRVSKTAEESESESTGKESESKDEETVDKKRKRGDSSDDTDKSKDSADSKNKKRKSMSSKKTDESQSEDEDNVSDKKTNGNKKSKSEKNKKDQAGSDEDLFADSNVDMDCTDLADSSINGNVSDEEKNKSKIKKEIKTEQEDDNKEESEKDDCQNDDKNETKKKLSLKKENEESLKSLINSDSDSDNLKKSPRKKGKNESKKKTEQEENEKEDEDDKTKDDKNETKKKSSLKKENEDSLKSLINSDSDSDNSNKSPGKKENESKKKKSLKKENEESLKSLLDSDSDSDNILGKSDKKFEKKYDLSKKKTKTPKKSEGKSPRKGKDSKGKESESEEYVDSDEEMLGFEQRHSDDDGEEIKKKPKKQEGSAKSKSSKSKLRGPKSKRKDKEALAEEDKNIDAKRAILESDSSDATDADSEGDGEDITKNRRSKLKSKWTQEQQLEGQVSATIKTLSKTVKSKLDEDGFVDLYEFPELTKLQRRKGWTTPHKKDSSLPSNSDDDDSDEEFARLMKFKVPKPAPKSKKKKREPISDKDNNESDEEMEEKKKVNKRHSQSSNNKSTNNKKKKEGLCDIDINNDDEQDDDDDDEEDDTKKRRNKSKETDTCLSLNDKMKKNILMSSDEDDDEPMSDEDDKKLGEMLEEERRRKYEERRAKKKEEEEKRRKEREEAGEDTSEEEEKIRKQKKGYMNLNISSSEDEDKGKDGDTDDEKDDYEDDSDEEDDDSDFSESPRKRRAFEVSDSDSDFASKKGGRGRRRSSSESEYDGSSSEEDKKSKRKRIKRMSSSDEGGEDEDEDEGSPKKDGESPSKKKKIRKIIADDDLEKSTVDATQAEEERKKRIKERQKEFNMIHEIDVEATEHDMTEVVLDHDSKTKEALVSIHEKLVKTLKPHQIKGIKFMWDATIESVDMLKKGEKGGGCILAHCMGLGKTLQIITYIHTVLTNKKINRHMSRVMVCCPVNTVYNWVAEFKNWLKGGRMCPFEVVECVSAKDLWGRAYRLDDWYKEGGVMIMGYDMFRNLSNEKNKKYKGKMKEIFQKTLLHPGPDIMVCDEGHILKNEKTALSKSINQIEAKRRIILTGTPLQNNLQEYHCMVQFVKPNLLGTLKEFRNRFVNPIEAGQCADALPRDVRRMKRRAHILHDMLDGCVQRFDYTVLKPFLPPKFEYVLSVQVGETQEKLYRYYLDNLSQGGPKKGGGSGLFVDFGNLSRIWTHPKVLELAVRRAMMKDELDDEMDDFICDETTDSEDSESEKKKKNAKGKKKKGDGEGDDDEIVEIDESAIAAIEKPGAIPGMTESGKVRVDWWKKVLEDAEGENYKEDEYMDKIEHSGKLVLLFDLLRECGTIGDKILVFSQSLLALDMIEEFLSLIDQGELDFPEYEGAIPLTYKYWKREKDYLRLDGSCSPDYRKNMCKDFNRASNERCRLFLISTRAGGLGINLVAANRVVIFDSSWNPSHDTQSIFRVYRFGQKKPCYIYRFVAQGTMEEKIYSRQITKESTSMRVVDEHQIKRYFNMADLQELYSFTPASMDKRDMPDLPQDRLLAEILKRQSKWIVKYHEHDSLLEHQEGEGLSEEERKAAWEDYENEKKGMFNNPGGMGGMGAVQMGNMGNMGGYGMPSMAQFSLEGVVNTIRAQNPALSQQEMYRSVELATKQIQKIHLGHYQRVQAMVYNLKNPMLAPEQRRQMPFGNHPEMMPFLEQQLRTLEENIQRENQVIQQMAQLSRTTATPQQQMSAGLVRGQPSSSGQASATANYVNHSKTTPVTKTPTPAAKTAPAAASAAVSKTAKSPATTVKKKVPEEVIDLD